MAYPAASGWQQSFFKVVNAVLPQVSLFDLGSRAANLDWGPVPAWVVLSLAGYMLAYGATMLVIAWFKFRRQAV